MAEELKKHGLFVDESYVLRVVETSIAKNTEDLKDENEVFLDSNLIKIYSKISLIKLFYYLFRACRF